MIAPNATFDTIEPYLEDLEARLDADIETALLAEWRQFADGEFAGDVFSPRRIAASPAGIDWRLDAKIKHDLNRRIPKKDLVKYATDAGMALDAEFHYLSNQVFLRLRKPAKTK